jgi:hypothetical protein
MLCSAPTSGCDQFILSIRVVEEIDRLAVMEIGPGAEEPGDDALRRPRMTEQSGDPRHHLESARRRGFQGRPPLNLSL